MWLGAPQLLTLPTASAEGVDITGTDEGASECAVDNVVMESSPSVLVRLSCLHRYKWDVRCTMMCRMPCGAPCCTVSCVLIVVCCAVAVRAGGGATMGDINGALLVRCLPRTPR